MCLGQGGKPGQAAATRRLFPSQKKAFFDSPGWGIFRSASTGLGGASIGFEAPLCVCNNAGDFEERFNGIGRRFNRI